MVLFVFLVSASPVYSAGPFSLEFYCSNNFIRSLFNVDCPEDIGPYVPPEETPFRSLQLRFFSPPVTPTAPIAVTPTPLPSPTPTAVPADAATPTPTPINCNTLNFCELNCTSPGNSCVKRDSCYDCVAPTVTPTSAASSPTPTVSAEVPTATLVPDQDPETTEEGVTSQVDWVYDGIGRCWSAWSVGSCSLLPHEGGGDDHVRDVNGDGTADVTCSQGTGTRKSTTLTNTSSAPITFSCERYTCNACVTGNGTHSQCDNGIDATASVVREYVEIQPGCTATCTFAGAYGTCLEETEPPDDDGSPETPLPTSTPVPVGVTTYPTPTLRPSQPGSCSFASGYCSVENLMRPEYFGNQTAAEKASMVCNKESGGDPFAANKQCLTGGTYDYSIGLFQINLIAHCSSALNGNASTRQCWVLDAAALQACESRFRDPHENIKYAVQLSHNGTNWTPWLNAKNMCNL